MDPEELHQRCGPVIRQNVRAFLRSQGRREFDGRGELDLYNDIFLKLIERDQRALRSYDPERGTIESFCASYTRSRLTDILRAFLRRQGIAPMQSPPDDWDPSGGGPSAEERAHWANLGRKIVDCVLRRIRSETGLTLFSDLYLRRLTDDEIVARREVERREIHQWRSTIKRLATKCQEEIEGAPPRSGPDDS